MRVDELVLLLLQIAQPRTLEQLCQIRLPHPPSFDALQRAVQSLRRLRVLEQGRAMLRLTDSGCAVAALPVEAHLGLVLRAARCERQLPFAARVVAFIASGIPTVRSGESADDFLSILRRFHTGTGLAETQMRLLEASAAQLGSNE